MLELLKPGYKAPATKKQNDLKKNVILPNGLYPAKFKQLKQSNNKLLIAVFDVGEHGEIAYFKNIEIINNFDDLWKIEAASKWAVELLETLCNDERELTASKAKWTIDNILTAFENLRGRSVSLDIEQYEAKDGSVKSGIKAVLKSQPTDEDFC